jgi:hypothetical protein
MLFGFLLQVCGADRRIGQNECRSIWWRTSELWRRVFLYVRDELRKVEYVFIKFIRTIGNHFQEDTALQHPRPPFTCSLQRYSAAYSSLLLHDSQKQSTFSPPWEPKIAVIISLSLSSLDLPITEQQIRIMDQDWPSTCVAVVCVVFCTSYITVSINDALRQHLLFTWTSSRDRCSHEASFTSGDFVFHCAVHLYTLLNVTGYYSRNN